MADIIILIVKASIAGLVFALGLRSKAEDIVELLRRPGLVARAVLAMYVAMPIFAVAATKLLALRTDLAVALIALALSPVPPILPRKQTKAGGDRSFAVALLVVLGVLSIVLVPLGVRVIGSIFDRQLDVAPSAIAWIVATLIVAPLLVGMALRRFFADLAAQIEPIVSKIAGIVLLLSAGLIVASTASAMLDQVGNGTVLLLAAFVVVGLFVGHWLGGPDPEERTDLALATASRHPGIALAVAHLTFPGEKAVTALVAIYLLVGILIGLPYVKWRAGVAAAKATGVPAT